jgi:hypothetical protein
VGLYLAHRHTTGIQGQYLIVESRPAGLVLGNELGFKATVAAAWDFYWQFAEFALERLATGAVAGVASGIGDWFMFVMPQVRCYLGLQGAFYYGLGELLE